MQLEALDEELPSREPRLLHKRAASKKLKELVQQSLESQAPVFQAASAMHGGGFHCSPGDVVIFQLESREHVGRIDFLVECQRQSMACVSAWEHVHGYMYSVQRTQSLLVHIASISACCIWSQKEQQAIVVRP